MQPASLPLHSSSLTANPYDDFENIQWVELASEPSRAGSSAFWHAIGQFTRELHWNKSFFDISISSEAIHSLESETPINECTNMPSIGAAAPPTAMRYVALRTLSRKTPSPIGGGVDGTEKSYVCQEWTVQYTIDGVDTAIFGLVIPENIVGPDNPRAMTYWPFHYPKTRAYRYTYANGLLRYSVIPLQVGQRRPISTMVEHVRNAALKNLIQVRKRMMKFDPIRGVSTYVKRVHHDTLVPEREYRRHYNRLREKYAYWAGIWNETEVTDPVKFVFEEMAIAAYLCALWEMERERESIELKQTFVDCGCGNGFLVYLLRAEGHSGIGVDLQRRRIWDRYPDDVRNALKHEEIEPSRFRPDQFDWIIGNHSDELTPWLPIFGARAQERRGETIAMPKLFILPCCFFDFDGKKLAFSNTRRTVGVPNGDGKYDSYVTWIQYLCEAVGFEVTHESLRIPSTKYRALICTKIKRPEQLEDEVIQGLVKLFALDAKLSRG